MRRLLIAAGAFICLLGFGYAAVLAFSGTSGDDAMSGIIGMMASVGGFFAWRATVNWILVYEPPGQSDQDL